MVPLPRYPGLFGLEYSIRLYQKCLDKGREPLGTGIIGARVLPKNWVARKPSNIYWNGIRTYHIFEQENMTIPDMVRLSVLVRTQSKSEKLGNRRDDAEEGDKDDKDAGRGESVRFFDLPEMKDVDWRSHLDIGLTEKEASFLRSKIEKSVPDKLLAYILKHNIDLSKYDRFEMLYADLKDEVPPEMARIMKLACDFNRLVYAARVRYNMVLSRGQNKAAVAEWDEVRDNIARYAGVNLEDVLSFLGRSDFRLRRFLLNLQAAFLAGDIERADEILVFREIELKTKARAKLCHAEDFNPNNWVGGRYLDYRFADAKRIVTDIYDGEGAANVSD